MSPMKASRWSCRFTDMIHRAMRYENREEFTVTVVDGEVRIAGLSEESLQEFRNVIEFDKKIIPFRQWRIIG